MEIVNKLDYKQMKMKFDSEYRSLLHEINICVITVKYELDHSGIAKICTRKSKHGDFNLK